MKENLKVNNFIILSRACNNGLGTESNVVNTPARVPPRSTMPRRPRVESRGRQSTARCNGERARTCRSIYFDGLKRAAISCEALAIVIEDPREDIPARDVVCAGCVSGTRLFAPFRLVRIYTRIYAYVRACCRVNEGAKGDRARARV